MFVLAGGSGVEPPASEITMTLTLRHPKQDDGAMAGARARKPNRVRPPRDCDQCGKPQSRYRHEHEKRCAACQIKTPPSDWRRLRDAAEREEQVAA